MAVRGKLVAEATALRTLDEAFRWGLAQEPRLVPVDVIIQDEYSHDVIFAVPSEGYLVFDTT